MKGYNVFVKVLSVANCVLPYYERAQSSSGDSDNDK